MLSQKQKERAEVIVEIRRRLAENEGFIDLILKLWEDANESWMNGGAHITEIRYENDVWKLYNDEQKIEYESLPIYVKETFDKISTFSRSDITYEAELEEIGFRVDNTLEYFSMRIK